MLVRASRPSLIAVAAPFFVNAAAVATWVPRIPEIKGDLALSASTLGLALFALPAGAVLALQVAGRLVVGLGARAVVRVSALALCASLPLLAVADGAPTLAGALALLGAAAGTMDAAMNTHAVAVQQAAGRLLMASFHATFSVGGAVGALAGSLAAAAGLAPLAHFVVAGAVLAAVAWAATGRLEATDRGPEPGGERADAPVALWTATVLAHSVFDDAQSDEFVAAGNCYSWSSRCALQIE